ncbi:hypothetical protein Bca101_043885 [Brassica carinata]
MEMPVVKQECAIEGLVMNSAMDESSNVTTMARLLLCEAEQGGLMSRDTLVRLESRNEVPPCSNVGEWRPQSGGRSSRWCKEEDRDDEMRILRKSKN